jgi:hypothetical protein
MGCIRIQKTTKSSLKKGMKLARLSSLHNHDLYFSQPVKLIDQGVYALSMLWPGRECRALCQVWDNIGQSLVFNGL